MEPSCEGGIFSYINGQGHITKMATMPMYGINIQKAFYRIKDHETWHGALCTQALQNNYMEGYESATIK